MEPAGRICSRGMSPWSLLVKSVSELDGSVFRGVIELDQRYAFEIAQDWQVEVRVEKSVVCILILEMNCHQYVVSQRQVEEQPCSAWTQARPCAATPALQL